MFSAGAQIWGNPFALEINNYENSAPGGRATAIIFQGGFALPVYFEMNSKLRLPPLKLGSAS
jgi:hypothetical protein